MFLNDTLTHKLWAVPMVAIFALQGLLLNSDLKKYIKNEMYMIYGILCIVIAVFLFLIFGKALNLLGPEKKVIGGSCDDVTDPNCIIVGPYNIYHHIFYCFIVILIVVSLVYTGLAFR